jgi:uncharacterized protein (TIGR02147 family)
MNLTHSVNQKLKDVFVERIRKNPQYSLRAYAKHLGLSPGGLSQILSGKKKLSVERAEVIAERMGLKSLERDVFLLKVEWASAKTEKRKSWILDQMRALSPTEVTHSVSADEFESFSRWYGLPLHELVRLRPGIQVSEIAQFFSVPAPEVKDLCERMIRLKLLVSSESGALSTAVPYVHIASENRNQIIQAYYRELLPKIEDAVVNLTPKERAAGAEVFSISDDQLPEVTRLTNQYLDDLQKLTEKAGESVRIYQALSVVFPLQKTALKNSSRKEEQK